MPAEQHLDRKVVDALGLEAGEGKKEYTECVDRAVNKYELVEQFPDGDHEEPDLRHDPDTVDASADDKELFLEQADVLGLR